MYSTVIECVPGVSDDVAVVADPATRVTVAIRLPSSKNETSPVGVPDDPDTVAVKVTGSPELLGLRLEATATVGVAPLTTCDSPGERLGA